MLRRRGAHQRRPHGGSLRTTTTTIAPVRWSTMAAGAVSHGDRFGTVRKRLAAGGTGVLLLLLFSAAAVPPPSLPPRSRPRFSEIRSTTAHRSGVWLFFFSPFSRRRVVIFRRPPARASPSSPTRQCMTRARSTVTPFALVPRASSPQHLHRDALCVHCAGRLLLLRARGPKPFSKRKNRAKCLLDHRPAVILG